MATAEVLTRLMEQRDRQEQQKLKLFESLLEQKRDLNREIRELTKVLAKMAEEA